MVDWPMWAFMPITGVGVANNGGQINHDNGGVANHDNSGNTNLGNGGEDINQDTQENYIVVAYKAFMIGVFDELRGFSLP